MNRNHIWRPYRVAGFPFRDAKALLKCIYLSFSAPYGIHQEYSLPVGACVCVCVPFVGAQQSHTDPSIDLRVIIGCIAPVGTQRLQHRHQIGASLRLGMLAFRYSVVSPTYHLSVAARQLTLG